MKTFKFEQCAALPDGAYFNASYSAMNNAQNRIWVNMFYGGIQPRFDKDFLVRTLLEVLQQKTDDGLNVKLLIGTDDIVSKLEVSNHILVRRAKDLGITVRTYQGHRQYSHRKYLLVDQDLSIVGSHNWSHRSLAKGRDDSVLLRSTDLTRYLSNDFHRQWTA